MIIASQRLGAELTNGDKIIYDLISEFPYVSKTEFTKALRNGGLGLYGRSFRFCTQEICFWVREYMKSNKTKLGI